MPYKKKAAALGAAAGLLALLYVLTLVFDPQRINARAARFTWLSAAARDQADRIEITRNGEKLELVLRPGASGVSTGTWFALLNREEVSAEGEGPLDTALLESPGPETGSLSAGTARATGGAGAAAGAAVADLEVPVKQGRVDDLFRILSTRGAFPRRGASAKNHEALGLGTGAARLIVRGGQGLPLLDLLVGKDDPSGKEVFVRKSGEDEFRSGDRLIASYVNGGASSWYDLKLFEETSPAQIQRVQVRFSGYTGFAEDSGVAVASGTGKVPESYVDYALVRNGDTWALENDPAPLNKDTVETWLKGILEAQGETFLPPPDSFTQAASITLERGDGSTLNLRIGAAGEDDKSPALVNGKAYAFVLPRWTVTRLLRSRTAFLL